LISLLQRQGLWEEVLAWFHHARSAVASHIQQYPAPPLKINCITAPVLQVREAAPDWGSDRGP
jgi:hypothetical protein